MQLHSIRDRRLREPQYLKIKTFLKCSVASKEASTSDYPRKPQSSSMYLFPPECIFCGRLEVKVSGKTERCGKFPVFKDKDGTFKETPWKQVESRSLELGLHRLHRMVQDENLFAREENFHQSCGKSFNLKFINQKLFH